MNNRINVAIIMYGYPLGVSVAIINTIQDLNRRGNHVSLFIDSSSYYSAPLRYNNKLFSLHIFQDSRSIPFKAVNKLCRIIRRYQLEQVQQVVPTNLFSYIKTYDSALKYYIEFVRARINNTYTHLMAFEFIGIAVANEVIEKQKLIYNSLELIRYELCPNNKMRGLKHLEKNSLPRVDYVLMANKERAIIFSTEYQYDMNKIKILPICGIGDSIIKRTSYFKKKFQISQNKTIVLYSTNFKPWAMCHEIIESMHSWPKDFVLVFHTWNQSCLKDDYFRTMLELAKDLPVYFSTDFVEHEDLPTLLASADLALLFYSPLYRPGDENFSEIAGSSNKLAEYLKATLPVIAYGGHSLNTLIELQKIGVYVNSPDNIGKALVEIIRNYNVYKEACIKYYNKQFRFETVFDVIYADLFLS